MFLPSDLHAIQEAMTRIVQERQVAQTLQNEILQKTAGFYAVVVTSTTILVYIIWNTLNKIFKKNSP